jgi:hypothetical protein
VTAALTKPAEEARVAARADTAGSMEQSMPSTTTPLRQALAPALVLAAALGAVACTPTLRIEASDKPITINLNVKIDQEIRVRLDKDLEDAIAKNPDLF